MNFAFPERRALCLAENATHNLHNLLTLRGAQVRDPRIWSRYLGEAMELFAGESRRRVRLAPLADLGHRAHRHVPDPAAGPVRLPARPDAPPDQPGLRRPPRSANDRDAARARAGLAHHGYYGSVNHNVKAIYQRYLGWYDATRPTCGSTRRRPPGPGTSRPWVVRTPPSPGARVRRRRGPAFRGRARRPRRVRRPRGRRRPATCWRTSSSGSAAGSENATWRNAYLSGAAELRAGTIDHTDIDSAGLAPALTVTQLFDSVAIRIVGEKAWDEEFSIDWTLTDSGEQLPHGAQQRRADPPPDECGARRRPRRHTDPPAAARPAHGRFGRRRRDGR